MIDMRRWFDRIMEGVRQDPSKNDLLSIMVRSGYPSCEDEQAELKLIRKMQADIAELLQEYNIADEPNEGGRPDPGAHDPPRIR